MATLYIVATPIGNLEDITLRAIRALKEVDLILCEDTRVTRNLLARYEIKTPTESYHAQSTDGKVGKILSHLEKGKDLALVTDAGTPGISDPGSELVSHIKKTMPDVSIVPIPGPSAFLAVLSASGVPTHEFVFLGFLPHKKGRETKVKEIAASEKTVVLYESPHRILKLLTAFQKAIPERTVVIGRELTKLHEEIISGTPETLLRYFAENEEKVRGEFVVVVAA